MLPTPDPSTCTPFPYLQGHKLELRGPDGTDFTACIRKLYTMTMSPVMEVTLQSPGDEERLAVLKLYDRRFGSNRKPLGTNELYPYGAASEKAWEWLVSSGKAESLLRDHQYQDDLEKPAFAANLSDDDSDDDDASSDNSDLKPDMEKLGEFECQVYHRARKQYATEVRAYQDLQELQGRSIPKFISTVKLCPVRHPEELPTELFDIPGILIERVEGFSFDELMDRLPGKGGAPCEWQELVQTAVDLTAQVNKLGVLHADCQPRNFLVNHADDKYQVVLLDFANSRFRSDFIDTTDANDKDGYLYRLHRAQNGKEIGSVMASKIFRATGCKITVTFPYQTEPAQFVFPTNRPSKLSPGTLAKALAGRAEIERRAGRAPVGIQMG